MSVGRSRKYGRGCSVCDSVNSRFCPDCGIESNLGRDIYGRFVTRKLSPLVRRGEVVVVLTRRQWELVVDSLRGDRSHLHWKQREALETAEYAMSNAAGFVV